MVCTEWVMLMPGYKKGLDREQSTKVLVEDWQTGGCSEPTVIGREDQPEDTFETVVMRGDAMSVKQ